MSGWIFKFCFYSGTFNYKFNDDANTYELSSFGIFLNIVWGLNIIFTICLIETIVRSFDFNICFKFSLVFLISLFRLTKARRSNSFFSNIDFLNKSSLGFFDSVHVTCMLLMVFLVLERFFFPFKWYSDKTKTLLSPNNLFPIVLQFSILMVRITYLTITFQICLISYIIENAVKRLFEELKDTLSVCVINNNDIFVVSDTLAGLSNTYNQNIQRRTNILKDLIDQYLKLVDFTKQFNEEYYQEMFFLYIFYLNCAEDFLTTIFQKTTNSQAATFHIFKLGNIICQFVYLSYRCYKVKVQYLAFENMLIHYDNLCEQDMFNLINLLLHKLNINRINFAALDFVYIDMELFVKTMIGLAFLVITIVTEKDIENHI